MSLDNATWPETGAGGPKKIVVCLECGEPGTEDGGFARYCSTGGEHGPTRVVSVLPASLADELAEALEEARIEFNHLHGLLTQPRRDDEFILKLAEVKLAEVNAYQAFVHYRAVRESK